MTPRLSPSWHPATRDRLADLAAVMTDNAISGNCWCAYWYRTNAAYKAGWGKDNPKTLTQIVEQGDEPGIIAYVEGQPAAWVSVAPRRRFDRLVRSTNFAPIDNGEVWAVNCFVVVKAFRRNGLMPILARLAAEFAFGKGAPAVEAYPIEPSAKSGPGDLFIGTVNAFRDAGYREVARPLPRRPIMRLMRLGQEKAPG
jgi:RimJ/RimL family protein N-acetyltransferase